MKNSIQYHLAVKANKYFMFMFVSVCFLKDIPNTISCAELKLDSLYFKCNDNNAESKLWHAEEQAQCSHLYQDANESSAPLEDEYLSPSACQRSDQYQGSAEG